MASLIGLSMRLSASDGAPPAGFGARDGLPIIPAYELVKTENSDYYLRSW
jgi:hypothetical protein